MKPTVRVYLNYFVLYFKTLHQYKFNWFLSLVKIPILFTLFWFIWRTLYQFQGGSIGSYSFKQMMAYLLAVQWLTLLISFNISEKISEDIQTGRLNLYLARPVHYLPTQMATFTAHFCLGMLINCFPFYFILYWLQGEWMSSFQYVEFLLALVGAGILSFLLECCLGVAGFWLHKIFGLHFLIMTCLNILGGKLIPLTLFPPWVQKLSYFSPLRAVYYEPIDVLFGSPLSKVLLLQFIWIVPLLFLARWLWTVGRLRYEAVG